MVYHVCPLVACDHSPVAQAGIRHAYWPSTRPGAVDVYGDTDLVRSWDLVDRPR